ncbi:hypothetical protein CONLIGDRAFT_608958 [Coniochaeta ligniaria NRRL 30616]|uniref:Zn(2)-C6 fungal-type domain-containing protein n=1 Tax=Coniochaeta ligniaria NRRL 30616 TaxID=1408157 RepID=A0A1J7J710_9PEZI|nr:hypothetical protein CONLIGDRAFT_608958 [Coniochaeta ligniaria NRRL 30616]
MSYPLPHNKVSADSTFSGHWPPTPSDFRLACEECHKRKIGCRQSRDATRRCCDACHINHRQCLFSLKHQVGRPRKATGAQGTSKRTRTPSLSSSLSFYEAGVPAISSHREQYLELDPFRPASLPVWAHRVFSPPGTCETNSNHVTSQNTMHTVGDCWVTDNEAQPWLEATAHIPESTTTPTSPPLRMTPLDDHGSPSEDYFGSIVTSMFPMRSSPAAFDTTRSPQAAHGGRGPSLASTATSPSPESDTTLLIQRTEVDSTRGAVKSSVRSDNDPFPTGRDHTQDFAESMRLCTEIHQRSQARPLNLLRHADQEQLSVVLQTVNELGHMALLLRRELSAGDATSHDHHQCIIMQVAVDKAVEIAAALIQFNLDANNSRFENSQATEVVAAANSEDQTTAARGIQELPFGAEVCDVSLERPRFRPTADKTQPGQSNLYLESVLSLFRLDYSLTQFRLFVSGHSYCQQLTSSASQWDKCPVGSERSLARIDNVRELCRTLSDKLHSLWNVSNSNTSPAPETTSHSNTNPITSVPTSSNPTTSAVTRSNTASSSTTPSSVSTAGASTYGAFYNGFDYEEWPNEAGFEGLTEHRGPVELEVKGTIPTWAAGSLYRTGPNGHTIETADNKTFSFKHWFDGLAHVHRFDIIPTTRDTGQNVRVQYSSRFQSEELVRQIKATGTMKAASFGQRTDPCIGIFSKVMSFFHISEPSTNIGVTVQSNAGLQQTVGHRSTPGIFIGTDTARLSELDPETLKPLGPTSHERIHPSLKGPIGPAHPCVDPITGDYFSFNIDLSLDATYRVFQISNKTGQVKILATFTAKACFIHSLFITPSYLVICMPIAYYHGVAVLWHHNLVEALEPFDEKQTCRWIVIDRHHGQGIVGEFRSPACFFFHSTNAWEEENGDVICEMVKFRNRAIIDAFYYDVLTNEDNKGEKFWTSPQNLLDANSHLVRSRLRKSEFSSSGRGDRTGLRKSTVLPWVKDEMGIPGPHSGDFGVIHPDYVCRKHRYVWSCSSVARSTLFDCIIKTDTQTREVIRWAGQTAHTPSEPIFIPRPATTGDLANVREEDDGVLLSVVLDGKNRTSYLLCLDAKSMEELGRAECEFAVGITFHGKHMKSSSSSVAKDP